MFSVTHSFIKKARYQAPTRAARMPQETDVQRSMRVLDVLNFDTLRSMINKPELLLEYKRFLALKVGAGDLDATLLSPPAEVDEVWHAHILDTKHYRTTCELLGHGFIDHNPKGGEDTAARDTRRTACLAAYKKAFGAAVPDIWASVRPALAPRPQVQLTRFSRKAESGLALRRCPSLPGRLPSAIFPRRRMPHAMAAPFDAAWAALRGPVVSRVLVAFCREHT